VSFVFFIVFVITIILLLIFGRGRLKWIYALFLSVFMVMELFQAIQWISGDVGSVFPSTATCTDKNKYFTYVAYFLIQLQLVVFAVVGWLREPTESKWKWITALYSILAFFNMTYLIYNTEHHIDYGYPLNVHSVISYITCTFIGPDHKLAWIFTGGNLTLQFTWHTYLVQSLAVFVQYPKNIAGIPVVWGGILVGCLIFQVSFIEIASYWCFLSVISTVFVWIWIARQYIISSPYRRGYEPV
jgi:hypothetical protein